MRKSKYVNWKEGSGGGSRKKKALRGTIADYREGGTAGKAEIESMNTVTTREDIQNFYSITSGR